MQYKVPDAGDSSPMRRIRRTHLLKAAALEFIIPHSPSKSTPPPQISPSPHLYSPTPPPPTVLKNAPTPRNCSKTRRLIRLRPQPYSIRPHFSIPSLKKLPASDPYPCKRCTPPFIRPPLPFQNNRIVKILFPKQPSHTPSVRPTPISQQHRLPRSSCRSSKIDMRPIPATNRFKLKKGAISRKIRNITPFRLPPRRKRNVSPIFKSPQNTDSVSSKS